MRLNRTHVDFGVLSTVLYDDDITIQTQIQARTKIVYQIQYQSIELKGSNLH